ncbi:MAG: hypothetical protein ABIG95_00760 [Candidatus Woesearchaeota archaeon]
MDINLVRIVEDLEKQIHNSTTLLLTRLENRLEDMVTASIPRIAAATVATYAMYQALQHAPLIEPTPQTQIFTAVTFINLLVKYFFNKRMQPAGCSLAPLNAIAQNTAVAALLFSPIMRAYLLEPIGAESFVTLPRAFAYSYPLFKYFSNNVKFQGLASRFQRALLDADFKASGVIVGAPLDFWLSDEKRMERHDALFLQAYTDPIIALDRFMIKVVEHDGDAAIGALSLVLEHTAKGNRTSRIPYGEMGRKPRVMQFLARNSQWIAENTPLNPVCLQSILTYQQYDIEGELRVALSKVPDDPRYHYLLADYLTACGKLDAARPHWAEVLKGIEQSELISAEPTKPTIVYPGHMPYSLIFKPSTAVDKEHSILLQLNVLFGDKIQPPIFVVDNKIVQKMARVAYTNLYEATKYESPEFLFEALKDLFAFLGIYQSKLEFYSAVGLEPDYPADPLYHWQRTQAITFRFIEKYGIGLPAQLKTAMEDVCPQLSQTTMSMPVRLKWDSIWKNGLPLYTGETVPIDFSDWVMWMFTMSWVRGTECAPGLTLQQRAELIRPFHRESWEEVMQSGYSFNTCWAISGIWEGQTNGAYRIRDILALKDQGKLTEEAVGEYVHVASYNFNRAAAHAAQLAYSRELSHEDEFWQLAQQWLLFSDELRQAHAPQISRYHEKLQQISAERKVKTAALSSF